MKYIFQKAIFALAVLFFYAFTLSAQIRITGVVNDDTGGPLPGVNVVVKGTATGSVTDANGGYSITVPDENAVLVFSFVGFSTQEIAVENRRMIDVTMSEGSMIDEVVVIGYGTMRKRDLTGAVGQVQAKELKNIPVRTASDALAGKTPGVLVTSSSGSPGSISAVRIRGVGSVSTSTDPLFVVDGLPQGGIGWLNPNDIESMEVLKDASAAAIYGARAANGVILVTTKRGSTSGDVYRSTVNFDAYFGWQNAAKMYEMMGAEEYMTYKNLAYTNGGQPLFSDFDTPEKRETYLRFLEENTGSRDGTNWLKEITNKNAPIQNYNLSVSGGTGKLGYHSSLAYMNQEGIVKGSDYDRISWRSTVDSKVADWFKLSSNLGLIWESRHNIDEGSYDGVSSVGNPWSGTIFCAMTADPTSLVYRNNMTNVPDFLAGRNIMDGYDPTNPFSYYHPVLHSNKANPVAQTDIMSQSVWTGIALKGGLAADIDITDFLKYRSSFGLDMSRGISAGFTPAYRLDGDQYNVDADVSRSLGNTNFFVFENTLTFDETFGDHRLLAMVGISSERTTTDNFAASKQGLVSNDEYLRQLNSAARDAAASGGLGESSMMSYFGRLFYSYQDKYMATVNIRRDGSSNFDSGKKWGVFPSFSLGWNFNRESFMEDFDWLTSGKLRLGWGEIGNHNIGGGRYLSLYGNVDYFPFGINYTPYQAAGRTQVGTPDIQWETTRQTNVGADLEFLKGSILFTVDWYNKTTHDMLVQLPIPVTMGYPNTPWLNLGSVENKGWEFSATYRGSIGDLNYSVTGNLFTYTNEVLSLGGGEPINQNGYLGTETLTRTEVGMPIGYFYGWKTDGIFQSQADVDRYVNNDGEKIMGTARPGDLKYVDINNDGVLDADDRTNIGSPFPKFSYGLTLNLAYKGFDLSAFFQGFQGNDIMNIMKQDIYSGAGWYNAPKGLMDIAWNGAGSTNEQPQINSSSMQNLTVSDRYIEDGSYCRLKNLQIGYTLPNSVFGKYARMQNVRFWIGAHNLLTMTKYSGLDPEIGSTNPRYMGIDAGFYPQARTIMVGVNASF